MTHWHAIQCCRGRLKRKTISSDSTLSGSVQGEGSRPLKPQRHRARRLLGGLILTVAIALGAVVLLAMSLVTARLVDVPALFLSTGVIAGLLTTFLVSRLALRVLGVLRRRLIAGAFSLVTTTALALAFASLFLKPLIPVEPRYVRDKTHGIEHWNLPTGSEIAVRKIDGVGLQRPTPIVFLHGGPGAYSVSLPTTVDVISRLANDGYDVYFYDQVGGGLSARLPDISQYTLERHLEDLAAVYERIGSDKIILIASSGGATLGASYMANNPTHVSAAVFSGPAPIYHPAWNETGDGGLDEQLSPEQKLAFSKLVETPRLLAALVLADINPRAAVRFAGEEELGALFDKVANEFYLPIAVCDMQGIHVQSAGYGFWSNRITSKSLRSRSDDPRTALRQNTTPVLVLRGECEYKKEQVAGEYVSVFPNAQLTTLKNAGHMVLWEQPDAFLQLVRQFLDAESRHSEF